MKKQFLILILALSTLFVFGQPTTNDVATFFANTLAEEADGYIEKSITHEDGTQVIYIGVPSYYDFDLVRMSLRKIVNDYSDISFLFSWKRHSEVHNLMWSVVKVDKYKILISYNINTKIITVTPAKA